jgi:hypothetical protein
MCISVLYVLYDPESNDLKWCPEERGSRAQVQQEIRQILFEGVVSIRPRASDNNAALVTHLRAQPQRTDSPESFLTVRVAFVETKCLSGIYTPTHPTNRLGTAPSKRPPLDTATPCLPEEFRSLAACILRK